MCPCWMQRDCMTSEAQRLEVSHFRRCKVARGACHLDVHPENPTTTKRDTSHLHAPRLVELAPPSLQTPYGEPAARQARRHEDRVSGWGVVGRG